MMYAAKLERIFRAGERGSGRMETSETEGNMAEEYRKAISARGAKITRSVMREPASRRIFMARAVKELLLGKELDLGNLKGEAKRGARDAYDLMQTMFGVVEIYETGEAGERVIKRARLMRACPAVYNEVRDL